MTVIASPSVRAYAHEKGVDLNLVANAAGRKGLHVEDIDAFLSGKRSNADVPGASPSRYWQVDHSQFGPVTEEPFSRIAQVAADNLAAANSLIPQVTHHDVADISAIERFRASMADEARERGSKLTALVLQVKALAKCLRRHPRFNASLSDDGKTLVLKRYVHIGIAVDTPAGLVVPVVRDVNRKGLWSIAQEISDLARRGRDRKLRPEEFGGASMSVSNLGAIGGTGFTPIVNPPEVAILGISKAAMQPHWSGEKWEPVMQLPLSLSYDHRVINGADAARFLADYAGSLADPRRLLI